jgi:universal stress protein A
MTRDILVPVDFSDASRAALDYGAMLARRFGARLTALHVASPVGSYDPLPRFPVPVLMPPPKLDLLEAELRRFVTPPGSDLPLGRVVVRTGSAADEILSFAREMIADFIVLGSKGHSRLAHWVFGSVTQRVLQGAASPVLVAPPSPHPQPFRGVMCCLDLSDTSAETLSHAGSIAAALRLPLLVVHVAVPSRWYDPWPIAGVDEAAVRQALRNSARPHLLTLVARCVPDGVVSDVLVTVGDPRREIERLARDASDLVALGVRGGSMARWVLRAGGPAVLLVPHRTGSDTISRPLAEEGLASYR